MFAGSWWLLRGDSFEGCELMLSADRTSYQVGDSIALRAEIRSDRAERIRLHDDRTKSFRLDGRAATAEVEVTPHRPARVPGAEVRIEAFELSPSQPHVLSIEGRVSQGTGGGILVDFGKFGGFEMDRAGDLVLWGLWIPARPSPVDALEDYTNTVVITLSEARGDERS